MSTDTLLNLALFAGAMLLMMRFGCGAHVMSHSHQHGGSGPGGGRDGAGGEGRAPAQHIDPVCGMTVDPASAKSAAYQGQVYYFCSQICREKFEAAPASYANAKTAGAATTEHEHHHGCC